MHFLLLALTVCALAGGCAPRHGKPATPLPSGATISASLPSTNAPSLIVTPGKTSGKIALVNSASRFVIVSFPPGTMPPLEQRLNVYRGGLKVAEIRISPPQHDLNTAADILAGECADQQATIEYMHEYLYGHR